MRYAVFARLRAPGLVAGDDGRPAVLRRGAEILVATMLVVAMQLAAVVTAQADTIPTPYPYGASEDLDYENPDKAIPEPGARIIFHAGGWADINPLDLENQGEISGWAIKSCQLPLTNCVTATGLVETNAEGLWQNTGRWEARYTTTNADVGRYIHAIATMRDPENGDTSNWTSNPVGPVGGAPDGTCPPGHVGSPPACVPEPGGACPSGQVGSQPACVNDPLPPGDGQYSNSCTDGNAKVVDGFAGSAYVELRVQTDPSDAQMTWVCYRAWNATGSVDVGGRVDLDQGDGGPGTPVLEPDSSGCSVTPVNTTVGDPGDPTYGPYMVGVNSTSSEARACLRVGSFHQRVTVPVPGVGGGVPVVHQDDPTVPDPTERQGDPASPSSTCQNTAGHTRLANLESGSTWISVYSAPGGPGETRLCVRAQGAVSHGGMLTLKSSTGVSPVVEGPVPDVVPSPCTSNVVTNDADPARFSIKRTPGTSNPASLCLSVGSSGQFGPPGQRFTLGTSGTPSTPAVWTPDPGTPG